MKIRLSEHFGYGRLLRFTLPSMVMLVFSSIYGVVDGFFVSNFVGKTAFTAVNFILPFLMILGSVGFMFGTGGGALIAKTMGEGDDRRANELFSLVVYSSVVCGVVLAGLGFLLLRPLAVALGAEGEMLQDCLTYGTVLLPAIPVYVLQYEFQCLCVTAEKPQLGLWVTVASGLTNMVLDALLVAVLGFGLPGAAAATALSQCVGGLLPLAWFIRCRTGRLRLGAARWDGRALLKTCTNGSSELMSNISMSLVSMLYNAQLLRYAGEDGIAAYGVLMYVSMIFQALFVGYSVGTAPVVSYHFGAGNRTELRSLLRKSGIILGGLRGGDVPGSPAAGRAAVPPVCGLRRRFAGHDPARLRHLLLRLCLFGIFHLRVFLLHRPQQRPGVGRHLLPAHAGVSGGLRPGPAAAVAGGRHLGVAGGGGGHGALCHADLSAGPTAGVSLLKHPSPGGKATAGGWVPGRCCAWDRPDL